MGDSGASQTTMSASMLKNCNGLKTEKRARPLKISLASSDYSVEVNMEAKATIEIVSLGRVNICVRNVPIWIMEEDMEKVLLGDDVLKKLGIDVKTLLMGKTEVDIDYEELQGQETFPYLGGDDEGKIRSILQTKVQDMVDRGMADGESRTRWEDLLENNLDLFRTILGFDPPAKLPALKSSYDPELAKKIKPNRIPYTMDQKKFLDYYTEKLIEHGMVYENKNAKYVSEAMVLPKVDVPRNYEEDYRLVVNLKRSNAATLPIYWPMQTLEEVQGYLTKARYFITMNLKNGYWQIELHEDCQELFSFCTHRTVLTPTRIPQGCTDAVMYFSQLMMTTFKERLYDGIIPWVDDLLLYAASIEALYELLKWTLQRAKDVGIKFSPKKLELVATEIKWCGKRLSADGVEVDPERSRVLKEMPRPTRGDQLMQFINAVGWIRTHLPEFSTTMAVLQTWMNELLKGGKRTRRRAKNVKLKWDDEKDKALNDVKEMLNNAMVQTHPKEDSEYCLFTDASDLHWGAILVQVENYDKLEDVLKQKVEPMYMLSGSFRGSQLNWSTIEKEAFAIIESIERLGQVLIRPGGFRIFTDHMNLVYIYGLYRTQKINVMCRYDRWAVKMIQYRYTIEHVPGERNLWADLLSRWGVKAKGRTTTSVKGIKALKNRNPNARRRQQPRCIDRHVAKPRIRPLETFEWPTIVTIVKAQNAVDTHSDHQIREEEGVKTYKERIWIPECLREQMIMIAHYGLSGHNGLEGTEIKL